MKCSGMMGLAGVLVAASHAGAWEMRCRFVERVGNVDVELPGNVIDASNGEAHQIRIQFGVFDDVDGPAPAGGFYGWIDGTLSVGGPLENSDEGFRLRVSPFNSGTGPNDSGSPPPLFDPFTDLTGINATSGSQNYAWRCESDGTPAPMPQHIVRGINTFVSVFAITINPNPGAVDYTVTVGGSTIGLSGWSLAGSPPLPDCGDPSKPEDDIESGVTYTPVIDGAWREIDNVLTVSVPAPGAVVLGAASLVGVLGSRRRKSRA